MNPNSILLYDLTGSLYERWAHLIEFAEGIRAGNSGSCPTGQAPTGLDASRGDPGRKEADRG